MSNSSDLNDILISVRLLQFRAKEAKESRQDIKVQQTRMDDKIDKIQADGQARTVTLTRMESVQGQHTQNLADLKETTKVMQGELIELGRGHERLAAQITLQAETSKEQADTSKEISSKLDRTASDLLSRFEKFSAEHSDKLDKATAGFSGRLEETSQYLSGRLDKVSDDISALIKTVERVSGDTARNSKSIAAMEPRLEKLEKSSSLHNWMLAIDIGLLIAVFGVVLAMAF